MLTEQRFRVPETRAGFWASCWLESSYAFGVVLWLVAMVCGAQFGDWRAW